MTMKNLNIELNGRGVCVVSLNRPKRHNSLDADLIENLAALADEINSNPAIRVVILTGAGTSFCAGGDLGWMKAQFEATRSQRIDEALALAKMLSAWNTLHKPVVARVQGNAFGGGVGLISVCDIAIATNDAKFGLTETKLGLVPATISPFVSARIGEGGCRDVWLSAHLFDARRAVELGLLRSAVDEEKLDDAIEAVVTDLLARSPRALADAKRLARSMGRNIDDKVLTAVANTLADQWETQDAIEGVQAFLSKRKPIWPSLLAGVQY